MTARAIEGSFVGGPWLCWICGRRFHERRTLGAHQSAAHPEVSWDARYAGREAIAAVLRGHP